MDPVSDRWNAYPWTDRVDEAARVATTSAVSDIAAGTPPVSLERHELSRLRAAAHHAARVFPGPIGELLARELCAHAEFGYRFDDNGLLNRVARQLLATPAAVDHLPTQNIALRAI